MNVLIFGNGNLSLPDFLLYYAPPIRQMLALPAVRFLVGDFRGVDTLVMELLKTETPHVSVYHVGEKPRYLPDKFRTFVGEWEILGGYTSDRARDEAMIAACTHFIGKDFNTDEHRKSGTQRNIERCFALGRQYIEGVSTTLSPSLEGGEFLK